MKYTIELFMLGTCIKIIQSNTPIFVKGLEIFNTDNQYLNIYYDTSNECWKYQGESIEIRISYFIIKTKSDLIIEQ